MVGRCRLVHHCCDNVHWTCFPSPFVASQDTQPFKWFEDANCVEDVMPTEQLCTKSENPTHGSEWMVSDPFYSEGVGHLVNPTNGSWWIVQIFSNWSALSFCSPIYAPGS